MLFVFVVFCFQAEDGIRDLVRSRGLGDVYKRQVLGKKYFAGEARQLFLDERLHPDALTNPEWNRHQERSQPAGRVSEIAVQDAVELKERLLVKRHTIHLLSLIHI